MCFTVAFNIGYKGFNRELCRISKSIGSLYFKIYLIVYIYFFFNQNLICLDECLSNSYEFAKEFNSQVEKRYFLWKNGFMAEMKQLPGLLR